MNLQNPNNKKQQKPRPLTPESTIPGPVARRKLNILGIEVDSLTPREILQSASAMMTSFHRHHIITANSLLILEAQKNPELKKACQNASLVIPDSSGVSWAAMTLHMSKLKRYPGIDLAFELCGVAESLGIPIYLLGGEPGVSKDASRHLYSNFPKLTIAGMRDGYFQPRDEKAIFEDIAHSRARLVLVAMGMPQQELWINKKLPDAPPALFIGVGGSFDVWAGKFKRAPKMVQQTGLEWLYRLKQEPTRWKRMAHLPRFALKVITSRF